MILNKLNFSIIQDPRSNRNQRHSLSDIIMLTICAVLSGCNEWNEIEDYGNQKLEWLKTFIPLKNGVPSHDTINRLFTHLDPKCVQKCFLEWVNQACELSGGKIINIDGKSICNSGDSKKNIVHLVSAWSNDQSLCLGQVKTNEKSNEITAIPELLDLLTIDSCIITIDAMGCQQKIATKIHSKGGDYIFAVKGNQKFLLDDIQEGFMVSKKVDKSIITEKGSGRIEKRTCSVMNELDFVCNKENWSGLKSLIKIESERTILKTGEIQKQTRYYISSCSKSALEFNKLVRSHWSIENNLHWVLDVVFREDYSTKEAGNSAENFSMITKIALSLLKKETSKKRSLKSKRLVCGWDNDYLLKVLFDNKNTEINK